MLLGNLQSSLANNIIQIHSSNCSNIVHCRPRITSHLTCVTFTTFSVWSILLFTFGYFYQLSDVSYTWSLLRLMCMLRVQLKYLFYLGAHFRAGQYLQIISHFLFACVVHALSFLFPCIAHINRLVIVRFHFSRTRKSFFRYFHCLFSLSSSQSDFRVSLQKWIYMCVHAWLGTVTYYRHWQSFFFVEKYQFWYFSSESNVAWISH